MKFTKSHTGYYGCERCSQKEKKGEFHNNRVIFPEFNSPLRTDVQFLELIDDGLHNGKSPLHDAGIGLVNQFVLDCMHRACFGMVKKLIHHSGCLVEDLR